MKCKGLLAEESKGSIILTLILVLLVFCNTAFGISIWVETDWESCAYVSAYNTTFRIMMDNDDFNRQYITLPLKIYSPDSSVTTISNLDIQYHNGFVGFWNMGNWVTTFGFDGTLPLEYAFRGEGYVAPPVSYGWPSGLGPQEYITFQFDTDYWPPDIQFPAELCIDTASYGDPYDWLFEDPMPEWNGPYCFDIIRSWNCFPVYMELPDDEFNAPDSYSHSVPYQLPFVAISCYGDPLNFEILSGTGVISGGYGGFYTYVFTPDISEAGESYNLSIKAINACVETVYAIGSTSINIDSVYCGDFNTDMNLNILDVTALINYIYKGGAGPAHFYHADVNNSDNINVLDVTRMIDVLYKGGEELVCSKIRDEFPLRSEMWWKYERFDSLTSVYDTVQVSVVGYDKLRYTFSTGSIDCDIEINNGTITTSGGFLDRMYVFPLVVGTTWGDDIIFKDTVKSTGSITVPAGTFDDGYFIKRLWGFGEEGIAEMWEYYEPEVGMIRMELMEYILMDGLHSYERWSLIEYNIP